MADIDDQLQMLVNRVGKNRRKLRAWLRKEGVTCFRMYDRDIPEIPLAVDWYEGRLNVSEYRVQREPPEGWAAKMARGLGEALGVPEGDVYVKTRARQRGRDQYERVGQQGREVGWVLVDSLNFVHCPYLIIRVITKGIRTIAKF